MADVETDVQLGLVAFIILALGVAGYWLYETFGNQGGNAGGNGSGGIFGGGYSADPTTGDSNGPINNIVSAIIPENNPGGGEISGTSETYTGALQEVITSPISSLKAIFGFGSSN